jgi:hypothetical protein
LRQHGCVAGNQPAGEKKVITNVQLYLAVGLPIIAVLASLTVSLLQVSGIREDIREIRSDIKILTGKVYELMGQKP